MPTTTRPVSIDKSRRQTSAVAKKFRQLSQASRRLAFQVGIRQPAALAKHPATRTFRAIAEEAQTLLETDNPYLVSLGEIGRKVKQRLDACQSAKPCRVVGCPRCARERVAQRTSDICQQAQIFKSRPQYTMLVAIGFGSTYWNGNFDGCKAVLDEDMKTFTRKVLDRLSLVAGYSLHLDADPMRGDTHIQQRGRENVIERENSAWHLHIHGVIALNAYGKEGLEILQNQLKELTGLWNLPIEIHLRAIQHLRPQEDLPGQSPLTEVVNYDQQSLAGYCVYSQKIVTGSPLGAEATRLFQRHLYGQRLEWSGGIFAARQDALKPLREARGLLQWFEHSQAFFEDILARRDELELEELDSRLYDRNLRDLRHGRGVARQLCHDLIRQRQCILRRKRRFKTALARLRQKYTGRLLSAKIDLLKRRARANRRKSQRAALDRQTNIYWCWDEVKSVFERVYKRTSRIIAALEPAEIRQSVLRLSDDSDRALESVVRGLVTCGMVYQARRSVREFQRAAERIANDPALEGLYDQTISRAVSLSQTLEDWNAIWPCWLEGENIRQLHHEHWWEEWLERAFLTAAGL